MVGMNDTHVNPANKGGLWHNSFSTTAIDEFIGQQNFMFFTAMPDFEHIIFLKVMWSRNLCSMNCPQIWYRDSFRVADMNFSKNVGVTESV